MPENILSLAIVFLVQAVVWIALLLQLLFDWVCPRFQK